MIKIPNKYFAIKGTLRYTNNKIALWLLAQVKMSDINDEITLEKKLMIAVVQAQDCDIAIEALENDAFSVTRLPSVGGFLGKRNATLLIGSTMHQAAKAKQILEKTCKKRISYIAIPSENAPLPMPMPTPITVGGVSLFLIDIEHYEEI